jgi:hypothetical protein
MRRNNSKNNNNTNEVISASRSNKGVFGHGRPSTVDRSYAYNILANMLMRPRLTRL